MSDPFAIAERFLDTVNDPIVNHEIMMDEFRQLQNRIIGSDLKDFDYLWLKEHRFELYATIKTKENEMEASEGKPLSVLLALIREWIDLVKEGCQEQIKTKVMQKDSKASDHP